MVRILTNDSIPILVIGLFRFYGSSWINFGNYTFLGMCEFFQMFNNQHKVVSNILFLSLFMSAAPIGSTLFHSWYWLLESSLFFVHQSCQQFVSCVTLSIKRDNLVLGGHSLMYSSFLSLIFTHIYYFPPYS